ncbi:DUF4159 domain-containing protein [Neomegalonema perideroedes]|uniref:DUF4159 domain-containing protein n=1 Tax=Neomegalonema perideroedes TaxID=217219 RepID=UPI00035CEBAE|nr:DUF4159 domain-containing protein [Neomegalonema perideroedes]
MIPSLSIGSLAFLNPWLLAALAALPILWWLLRATPPAPLRERFPGVAILLGVEPPEKTPKRTPWWLLALRILAAALLIFAFAQPVLDPRPRLSEGEGPAILVLDDGWASAPDWEARREAAREILAQAERAGRPAALIGLAEPPLSEGRLLIEPRPAADALGLLEEMRPKPWAPHREALAVADLPADSYLVWIHDGLDGPGAGEFAARLAGLSARAVGPLETARGLRAEPPGEEPGKLKLTALRAEASGPETRRILAWEAPENAAPRPLASAQADFAAGETSAAAEIEAPLDLLNRVAFLSFEESRSAGGATLLDNRFKRKRVALVSGERAREDQPLLSGGYFLREALAPLAETQNVDLMTLTQADGAGLAAFDAVILVDVGAFAPSEAAALEAWVRKGGTLIRFAGPATLAAADDQSGFKTPDPLLPVRLRPGRRTLGGAMSWGEPQPIAPFDENSPFFGLTPPADVLISRQILAEPDVDLPPKVWAGLADGSPLVTAERRGEGGVVFLHVSAEPSWSSLPLSGLFIEMLGRTLERAAAFDGRAAQNLVSEAEALWTPTTLLDAWGVPQTADAAARPATGARLAENRPDHDAPPGIYARDGAQIASNLMAPGARLAPLPAFPANVVQEPLGGAPERPLKPLLLTLALLLLAADALGTLLVTGRLRFPARGAAAGAALLALGLALGGGGSAFAQSAPERLDAETLAKAEEAALEASFGYVLTGDSQIDEISRAGLYGLAQQLTARTSIEPGPPEGVDVERDELNVYPFLYWPITARQETPSSAAVAKLNAYLRQGGMILFDTRDAHLAFDGRPTPGAEALRRVAQGLDLPPLAPLDERHVLARSFFLLKEFPGRWDGGEVWVEAAPNAAELEDAEALGFSNDGVSPVIVGGRDWAGAWALRPSRDGWGAGDPVLPMPEGGERRRETAVRFGVNVAMYAYTGSYKSDQVHIPMLLERLGR